MISKEIYLIRREKLKKLVGEGIILLPGNKLKPINYSSNTYRFRQDSTFYYFTGIDRPDLFLIIDIDNDNVILFGEDYTEEDFIWMGVMPKLIDIANEVGIEKVETTIKIKDYLNRKRNSKIHYLPIYSDDTLLQLSYLLDLEPKLIINEFSKKLVGSVFELRSVKEPTEIMEIENTLSNVTYNFFIEIMKSTRPGINESEIRAIIENIIILSNCSNAFEPICTVRGEILHNNQYKNLLKDGQLLLVDAGAESQSLYATDITRTIPVSGKYNKLQKELYEIVLMAQNEAINKIKPGIKYIDIHQAAAKVISEGLLDIGLMKGSINDILEECAYALFFPHGIGHMLGLDVHDMENFGEDLIGYDNDTIRSDKFGLKYLRYAKELNSGNVLTVEPGIYFNKFLIEKWAKEKKFSDFIDYSKLEKFYDFGGIRIEDDILVTPDGAKILGTPIPKKIEDIENLMS